jgi:hypothetical protein
MGKHYETGYSADVEGYLVVGEAKYRLAKSNGCTFVLAESCQLPAGTQGDMLVIVDGNKNSRRVVLDNGINAGQTTVGYRVLAPF